MSFMGTCIRRRRRAMLALAGASILSATPAFAEGVPAAPTDSAMVNLVRLLVEQGVLTRDKGDALVQQAQAEAQQVRAAAATAPAGQQMAGTALPPPAAGSIRVPYVPETVRAQIKDELRTEVMAQARSEGWAAPGQTAPDWTRRLTLFGDVRVRSESEFYSNSNSNLIFDFGRINRNGPTDVLNDPLPILNASQDRRNQMRLRARLGLHADIDPHVQAGLMLATGDDNGPISTNVNLGGGFAKRDFWLQEAWLQVMPTRWSMIELGRFSNPFMHTDLLFDPDLSLDGVYASVDVGPMLAGDDIQASLRAGAFPLDFGDPDYPSTDPNKRSVTQKYMLSAQAVFGMNVVDDVRLEFGAAYHSFVNVQGELSEPCALYAGATECSTDGLRPFFLRKGNTVSPLRQIAVDPQLPAGQIQPQPQFFGLTFNYDILDINAAVTYKLDEDISVRLAGNYLRNLAFKKRDLCRNGLLGQPFNNGGTDGNGDICAATNATSFVGGNEGYLASVTVGHHQVRHWGQWNLEFGYRYLESDAVLDSLTDSDFHLGGTNAKGYFVGGRIGLYNDLSIGARWLSANEISGDPFAIDVLQIDLQVQF